MYTPPFSPHTRDERGLTRLYDVDLSVPTPETVQCSDCGADHRRIVPSVMKEYRYYCQVCKAWFCPYVPEPDGDAMERLT